MKMKKIMLLASGILFALAPLKMLAQEEGVKVVGLSPQEQGFNDTLVIKLKGSDKILFVGDELKQMVKYQNADSLKQLFINDFEKATNDHSLSKDVQLVHYFVHESGKRRLKAENPEFSDNRIDPAYEIKRLNLDLPKFQYIIHDLNSGYEIQIYVDDPEELKAILSAVILNDAIHFAATDKKVLRRTYKLEMTGESNTTYKITGKTQGRQDAIWLGPSLGVGILGNAIAPVAGFDLMLSLSDKYSVGKFKTGLGYNVFPIVNSLNGEISNVNIVESYDLKFLFNQNVGTRGKSNWIGLQGGLMKSYNMSTYNNAYKIGLLYEGSGSFNYAFDFIRDKDKYFYGLTVKIPF